MRFVTAVLICAMSFLPLPGRAEEPLAHEILRLRVVNDNGGPIAASKDGGATWTALGCVVQYTTQVNRKGYTASKWVASGHVAATSVNAIHISAGYNAEEDRGVVFSLLPKEFLTAPKNYSSFLSPDSSIYTDLPAGTAIFGGGEAPFVGNDVLLETRDGLGPLPPGYVPAQGDVLVIIVAKPVRYPSDAVFENCVGGAVTLGYPEGAREQIGTVVRPVQGVGRFLGSVYADSGRIRANHAGVIDVSTSPLGRLGGFQIIPLGHAHSPEMENAWKLTQWMIVSPLEDCPDPLRQWGAITPLFYGYLRPDYRPDDLQAPDWENRLLARFLVDVDMGEGWRPLPAFSLSADPAAPLPDWAGSALAKVRRIRLLFPLADR